MELMGDAMTLRPLQSQDFEALYAAASDPLIWEQHPDPLRYQRDAFQTKFFEPAVQSQRAYVVIDKASGQMLGSSRYYDYDADKSEIAIGYTFLARSHWGGGANGEMKRLMLDHAFAAGITRVWFHIGEKNMRSRKALEKIGGRLSHAGKKEMLGVLHDYVFYAIDAPTIAPNPKSHSK
ncbi:MAG: GNAT family N-acetyltransferase [Cytophagales bacterium]|nr:GNAT family N-acetyltransferase [Cytophagales bacterium]